ncbi:5'-methylthioadenosine/adenosylhomocysteine nucleosidase [Ligilactobacillus agilis]|uniref:adenosylhomocysteine nucleosidase n=1 Tax=Ligilactobacillus agilis TaxID=1601 RepID=A0A231QFS5_9LACO|nr:5'-methylthioadenosine/adenosylhomocysteine nucleosidase [Ligilactobacillus agilis]MCI5761054.1 5'-methylthioadenosine/adenosylhomocysteine nucleosidase [Ligilactobacillus agilis]MDM8280437.1 5'-methylthioadenosine/adenosylhomocysteine nucleosidase [Ligilactobacillus agilis]NJE32870.1 5'-methylthioadenosine/adenosylhomocysteine nucleosidase [Ligilactobacillus agilis]OXC06828.1 5'-methylthioadenosine/S-adenosylhomocysteine nucleosidase [Ligilactobacillus agilis]OXC08451.1 5'-methylthioadenos
MKYGIICAMEEEIKALRAQLTNANEENIANMIFYSGQINDHEVVLVRAGIGKVQAGVTTAFLIENFKVDAVINSGSAGGIGTGLAVGDLVLSTGAAYHDASATVFGYKPGQLPQQPQIFEADQELLQAVSEAASQAGLQVKPGLIVTGDQFVSSQAQIAAIKEIYPQALCCEMEGAAVAQVAYQFDKPFLIVRAMSDVGDEDAGQSFDEFIIDAGKKSAQMILNLLA